ncbi:rho gtpase activation protein [Anaeramoeba flamelloides]|uniref:Rho gtpase activation protein n=1 Tax=Anaeramoeba flamelloides TaxID=1746091 RepID=A0AAV7Z2N4_9EUKA|nr:rho gtpase activation protein [Anaeramoeba flamelloides]
MSALLEKKKELKISNNIFEIAYELSEDPFKEIDDLNLLTEENFWFDVLEQKEIEEIVPLGSLISKTKKKPKKKSQRKKNFEFRVWSEETEPKWIKFTDEKYQLSRGQLQRHHRSTRSENFILPTASEPNNSELASGKHSRLNRPFSKENPRYHIEQPQQKFKRQSQNFERKPNFKNLMGEHNKDSTKPSVNERSRSAIGKNEKKIISFLNNEKKSKAKMPSKKKNKNLKTRSTTAELASGQLNPMHHVSRQPETKQNSTKKGINENNIGNDEIPKEISKLTMSAIRLFKSGSRRSVDFGRNSIGNSFGSDKSMTTIQDQLQKLQQIINKTEMEKEKEKEKEREKEREKEKKKKKEKDKKTKVSRNKPRGNSLLDNDLENLTTNILILKDFVGPKYTESKGFRLRRKRPTSIKELLSYSSTNIQSPITKLPNSKLSKYAINNFKYLLIYMGETRLTKKYKTAFAFQVAQLKSINSILDFGINHLELRDEIYLQICKQINDNPNPHSTFRGWGALCLITQTFSPSKELYPYMVKLLNHSISSKDERVSQCAKYAKMKMQNIYANKIVFSKPSETMIQRIFEVPFDPIVFGVTLQRCMEIQKEVYPEEKVPHILYFLAKKIRESGGFKNEGIFRVPGNANKIVKFKEAIDSGQYEEFQEDSDFNFVYASTLKLWLRELADPLVPVTISKHILEVKKDTEMIQMAENLPDLNKLCLAFIIDFFKEMSDPEIVKFTKMDVQNFSLMLAPNIIRIENISLLEIAQITKQRNLFVSSLIKKWDVSKYLEQIHNSKN